MDKSTYIFYRNLLRFLETLNVGAVVCRVVEGNLYSNMFEDDFWDDCPCCTGRDDIDISLDKEEEYWFDSGMNKY